MEGAKGAPDAIECPACHGFTVLSKRQALPGAVRRVETQHGRCQRLRFYSEEPLLRMWRDIVHVWAVFKIF